jgi:predicted component of type VI protein secretion system
MVVRFHVVAPAAKQRTFSVRLPILLGRGEEAKLRIQHDLVSRRHCEFFERQGQVYVRDLGSTNGTFLNDEQVPVSTKTAVPPGGLVRVGGLSFTVEYERPSGGDSTASIDGQGDRDALAGGESRVETGSVAINPLEEQPDFKIEHSQQFDEGPAGVMVSDAMASADVAAPAADVPVFPVGEEAAGSLPPAESSGKEPAAADVAAETPASGSDHSAGFAFLAGGEGASPPAETPQWPSPDAAAPADDAPDDDQLNAFFKGFK